MDAAPIYFWHSDGCAWIRVAGPGTRFNSTGMKDFAKDAIKQGFREFVVDLRECPEVDSTFMGTLAFIALHLRHLGEGTLRVSSATPEIIKSFTNLGLDQLFEISSEE